MAGNGIMPVTGSGVYGKTLMNPQLHDFMPRVGFAFAITPDTVIRGGFGTGYVHYTRAGSGDITGINAPQAQFAAVTQITPTTTNHCTTPLPAQIIAAWINNSKLLCHFRSGISHRTRVNLQPRDRQHYLGSQEHA